MIVLAIVFSPRAPDGSIIFLQAGNLTDVLRQMSIIGIMSLGMTFVILTGGIDLSVGSILALSTSITAMALTMWLSPFGNAAHIAIAIAASILACTMIGAMNGYVIAKLRMQPFIVTLASMIGVRGLAKHMTNNANIDIGFGENVPAVFAGVFQQKFLVISSFIILAAIFWIVLDRTVFGRYVRAVGDNERAALYSGLPIRSVKTRVYLLSGALSGFAGVLYAAANHQGNPNAGNAYELDAIANVVIGGTSLAGGKGSISGTITGTFIMGVLTNSLRLNNVNSNVEMMVKAVIIVIAVAIQKRDAAS